MNPIKPYVSDQIPFPFACCENAGLGSTLFHLLGGTRWKASIWCVSNSHKSFEAKAPLIQPQPSLPVSCTKAIFCSEDRGEQRKQISDLSKETHYDALLIWQTVLNWLVGLDAFLDYMIFVAHYAYWGKILHKPQGCFFLNLHLHNFFFICCCNSVILFCAKKKKT